MSLFSRKKRVNFFDLLVRQMVLARDGMNALLHYCRTNDPADGEAVERLEKEGDMARRVLIDELNKTFITPFDREDLFDLSRAIDDVLDYAYGTVDEFRMYKIGVVEHIVDIVETLSQMCHHLYLAISNLEHHKAISAEEALKAKKLENVVAKQSYGALAVLYEEDDFQKIFKHRDVIRHLNHAADIGDGLADMIMNVIVQL